jgi:hypothetical protein
MTNAIKSRSEMEPVEYAALMVGFHAQLDFAKSIKFNKELVPHDMLCMVDSGRAAGMSFFARE